MLILIHPIQSPIRSNRHVVRHFLVGALAIFCLAGSVQAQDYPSKPVRLLVGFAPGGGADIVARVIGQKLGENLKHQFIVDNRPGAGSAIASDMTAKAAADGYTLLMISNSHAVNAGFSKNLPYDPVNDFAPVILVASAPLLLVTNPTLRLQSVNDLIELARAKPAQLNFASSGTGGSSHLAGELLKRMANIDIVHVPYTGVSPAITDVISGQVQMIFSSVPAALPQAKAGRLKALAVTSAKRTSALTDVPTISESGVPGYEATNWYGVLAPAHTAKPIIEKLNTEILKVMGNAEVGDVIHLQGADLLGGTPAEFGSYLRSEVAKWTKIIKEAKIRAD